MSSGIISTIVGAGTASYSGDGGAATSATLNNPAALAIDSSGALYIADSSNGRIRKVQSGIITTIAGTGVAMLSGDGGPATSATLNCPYGIALDSSSNVYIADLGNHCIRKITVSTGIMTTVAGTGVNRYNGDNGAATSAALNYPYDVSLDSAGNIYIADTYNNRVRKVTVSSGIMTTIAGTGISSYSGDGGAATSAAVNFPSGVSVDSSGNQCVYTLAFCNDIVNFYPF